MFRRMSKATVGVGSLAVSSEELSADLTWKADRKTDND
jgi:hypothetical protein